MSAVIIVIHLMVVLALIAVILLQRSEGGALGIGGGGGGGGGNFMTGRGAANALSRATTFLAIGFFATSIALSLIANFENTSGSILDNVPGSSELGGSGNGILDALPGALPETPAEPTVPAAPVSE
ncbi:MAG: preprotein translocase subunit SecG [Hyphomicrobiales bacterium]